MHGCLYSYSYRLACVACHTTDGPLKMGPPRPSVANYVAMDHPPDQVRLP